jgi:hypothetical protein
MNVSVEKYSGDSPASRRRPRNDRGSVLVIAMILCALIGMMMASYLMMLKSHLYSVTRSQAWNASLMVAEAGVEEAMAHLNDTNTLIVGLSGAGWTRAYPLFIYTKTNYIGNDYYGVIIDETVHTNPIIYSTGYVAGPISSPALTRSVRIKTKPKTATMVNGSMIVKSTIDFKGNGVGSDSFNSSDTNHWPGGIYTNISSWYSNMDHGDITTLSSKANMVTINSGSVKGVIHTAPGGLASVGSSASVGDNAWVNSGTLGLEAGHELADATNSYPDATLPDLGGLTWTPAISTVSVTINGTNAVSKGDYGYSFGKTSPNFQYINDSTKIDVIYVQKAGMILRVDNITFSTKAVIYIAPGASLALYVTEPTFALSGQGVINTTGVARNFQYYGLPSNTQINLGASTDFVGEIYAPEAAFTLNGGGNSIINFVGTSITYSSTLNGHFNFHYDQNASVDLQLFGYRAYTWDEL